MSASQRNHRTCSGSTSRLFLPHRVKAAAVNHPHGGRRRARSGFFLKFAELRVQPREVIGLPNPHDPGKNVEPAHAEIKPFSDGRSHLLDSWADSYMLQLPR